MRIKIILAACLISAHFSYSSCGGEPANYVIRQVIDENYLLVSRDTSPTAPTFTIQSQTQLLKTEVESAYSKHDNVYVAHILNTVCINVAPSGYPVYNCSLLVQIDSVLKGSSNVGDTLLYVSSWDDNLIGYYVTYKFLYFFNSVGYNYGLPIKSGCYSFNRIFKVDSGYVSNNGVAYGRTYNILNFNTVKIKRIFGSKNKPNKGVLENNYLINGKKIKEINHIINKIKTR